MTDITRWWWVRHAPVVGFDCRFYGGADVDCDVSDTASFENLAGWLPKDAVWITSHLKRAHETADALISAGIIPDERLEDPDIGEQQYGEWEGITYTELAERQLEAANGGPCYKFWLAPADHRAPGGGESFVDVIDRVSSVMRRVSKTHEGRDIVAVSHGGQFARRSPIPLRSTPTRRFASQWKIFRRPGWTISPVLELEVIGGLSSSTCGRDTARTEIWSNLRRVNARHRFRLSSPDGPLEPCEFIPDLCRRVLHDDHDRNRQKHEQAADAVEIERSRSVCTGDCLSTILFPDPGLGFWNSASNRAVKSCGQQLARPRKRDPQRAPSLRQVTRGLAIDVCYRHAT